MQMRVCFMLVLDVYVKSLYGERSANEGYSKSRVYQNLHECWYQNATVACLRVMAYKSERWRLS